jgi:hypothetical protein
MSVRCPSCLTWIAQGDLEWRGSCQHRADFERPRTGIAELLENGVPCRDCAQQLIELGPKSCGRILPSSLLDPGVRQAFCVVIGIGQSSHSAADNAAALLVWRMRTARLAAARRWVHANDEAARIWRLGPDLRKYLGRRFSLAPLLIGLADTATWRVQAQAAMLVRSFDRDGGDLGAWLSAPECARAGRSGPQGCLTTADQIVLAIGADELAGEAPRRVVEEHARAVAQALTVSHQRTAQRAARDPRLFLLLVDQERRFLASLGPGAGTPETCAVNGGSAAWRAIAQGYVFDNYRLAELIEKGGLDRRLMTPLYGSQPVGDEPALLGIEAWSEHLLSLLMAGGAGDGDHAQTH